MNLSLMYRSLRPHARVELDLAEGALVAGDILLQEAEQRLRLLRAQVDALKVLDFDLLLGLLLQGSEDEEKIPDVDPHLHAVGVVLAIVGEFDNFTFGCVGRLIRSKCNEFAAETQTVTVDVFWLAQDERILDKLHRSHTSAMKTNDLKGGKTLLWEVPCGAPSAIEFRFLQHLGGLGHL